MRMERASFLCDGLMRKKARQLCIKNMPGDYWLPCIVATEMLLDWITIISLVHYASTTIFFRIGWTSSSGSACRNNWISPANISSVRTSAENLSDCFPGSENGMIRKLHLLFTEIYGVGTTWWINGAHRCSLIPLSIMATGRWTWP